MASREIAPSQAHAELRGRGRGLDGWMKTEIVEAMQPNSVETECDTNLESFYLCKFVCFVTILSPDRSTQNIKVWVVIRPFLAHFH